MKWMEVSGSDADAVRREVAGLCEGREVQVIDASEDRGAGIVGALTAPALFGAPDVLLVTGADRVTAAHAAAASGVDGPYTVIFTGGKGLSAAARKKFDGLISRKYDLPTSRGAVSWCRARSQALGVALPAGIDASILEAVVDPVAAHRFDTALSLLASVGRTAPTRSELEELLSGVVAESPVWAVADAVVRGDLAAAVTALEGVEPIVALSITTSRVQKVAFALAHPSLPAAEVAAVVGGSPAAARMLTRGVSADAETVAHVFDLLVNAEVECRSGRADTETTHHVVLAAVVQSCYLLAPR